MFSSNAALSCTVFDISKNTATFAFSLSLTSRVVADQPKMDNHRLQVLPAQLAELWWHNRGETCSSPLRVLDSSIV